jgi:hypothetical protein
VYELPMNEDLLAESVENVLNAGRKACKSTHLSRRGIYLQIMKPKLVLRSMMIFISSMRELKF